MNLFPNKYEKESKIIINGKETTLIDHLKLLRTEKNLSKAQISRIIKNNDYWYSQIEMSDTSRNKGDDNRRKYIKRLELLNIISVICFNAKNSDDLIMTKKSSENYIDNVIGIRASIYSPYTENLSFYKRTSKTQEKVIENLIESIKLQLSSQYKSFLSVNATNDMIDEYILLLNNFNESLKADRLFAISLAGLPLAKYLHESTRNEKEEFYDEVTQLFFELEEKDEIEYDDIKYRAMDVILQRKIKELMKKHLDHDDVDEKIEKRKVNMLKNMVREFSESIAESNGESVNGFINKAMDEKMEKDNL